MGEARAAGTRVTVTPPSGTLEIGATLQLQAAVVTWKGTVQSGRTVTWISQTPGVATVDANGLVTARSAGAATIVAQLDGAWDITGTASILVLPAPRIVFTSDRNGGNQAFVMALDGSAETAITSLSTAAYHPFASPSGARLAYVSNVANGFGDIYVSGLDGSDPVRLTDTGAPEYVPQFSPDGSRIVFISERTSIGAAGREVFVMNSDGSGQTRLTFTEGIPEGLPAWTPDGQSIVFSSERDGDEELYRMSATGDGVTRLTMSPGHDVEPNCSPDGRWIAFVSDRSGQLKIYLMHPDGSELHRLTAADGDEGVPRFSQDGQWVAFYSNVTGSNQVFLIHPDGSGRTQLTTVGENSYPSWTR